MAVAAAPLIWAALETPRKGRAIYADPVHRRLKKTTPRASDIMPERLRDSRALLAKFEAASDGRDKFLVNLYSNLVVSLPALLVPVLLIKF